MVFLGHDQNGSETEFAFGALHAFKCRQAERIAYDRFFRNENGLVFRGRGEENANAQTGHERTETVGAEKVLPLIDKGAASLKDEAKVFACGDMRLGASLVVWAIREGRECARAVDQALEGYTNL